MITNIKVHNLFSIKDIELNFEKGRYHFLEQYVLDNKVSNPIAIYGRNGSGKSSLYSALESLVLFLVNDQTKEFPFIRNLYYKNEEKSSIILSFEIEDNQFEYGVETDYKQITEEFLNINKEKIIYRKKDKYEYKNKTYKIESNLYSALRKVANEIDTKDTVSKAYYYLASIVLITPNKKIAIATSLQGTSFNDNIVEKSNEIKKILKTYKSFPIYDIKSRIKEDGKKEYYAKIETKTNKDVELPLEYISDGMYDQSMMLSILLTIPKDGVLVIDELEVALHPLTINNFINEVTKRNIQLIFTSHNTNILTYLRPDNIVFANWKDGESTYKRLNEIYENIREVNNIEKMYLSSTFDEDIEN